MVGVLVGGLQSCGGTSVAAATVAWRVSVCGNGLGSSGSHAETGVE